MFVEKKYLKNTKCLPDGYFRMLTTKEFPVSELPYVSLILVEPTMVSKELYEAHIDDRNATMDFTVGATTVRRDAWPSREEAFKWLSKRFPWQVWDPRVVRLLTVGTPAYSHVIFLDNRRYDRNTVFKTPLHHQAASSSNAIGGKKQSRILILRDILRLQRRWDTFVMRFPFTLFGVARNISCKFPPNCLLLQILTLCAFTLAALITSKTPSVMSRKAVSQLLLPELMGLHIWYVYIPSFILIDTYIGHSGCSRETRASRTVYM
jgi:hypothetical protein